MKAHAQSESLLNQLKPLQKCESTFMQSESPSLSGWECWAGRVRVKLSVLWTLVVRQKALIILVVNQLVSLRQSLSHNRRKVVGIVLWMVGIGSLFAHLFFDPYSMEHQVCHVLGFDPSQCWNGMRGAESTGWCYTSWFDYLVQTRTYFALIFFSVALPLLIPSKFTVALASLLHGIGWCWVLHYSFFSTSYETINAFPEWRIAIAGLVLGFSIVMSADYFIHAYNHRVMAFEKRLETLYNGADLLDDRTFKVMFKRFVEEKQAFQKQF